MSGVLLVMVFIALNSHISHAAEQLATVLLLFLLMIIPIVLNTCLNTRLSGAPIV